jgi:MFS family permease
VSAWLHWAVPAAVFLVAFFHRTAPGVIAKDLMRAFDASGALIGLLSSVYFYAYAGFMIPGGVLIDAYGVRRVVAAGGAVMAFGTVTMAVATSTWPLFAGRFLVGTGATVTFVGVLKIASAWFPPRRFGTMSALTATVGIFGSLVATAPLATLVAVAGWRRAFIVVGLGTLAASVLCAWLVRDRPANARADGDRAPTLREISKGLLQVLANRHTWPPFLAFFCLYSALGNLLLWSVPCLRDVYGLSTLSAAGYASAVSLALLGAAPLTGILSDRMQRRRAPYTLLSSALAVLWIVLVLTLGVLPLWGVFALLFGMGTFGAAFVLTWPIGREVNPPHLAGVAVAVVNLGGFLGAALTQAPLGAILDARWSGAVVGGARVYPVDAYRAAFAVCAGLAVAAAALSPLLRETRAANVYTPPCA